MSELKVNGKAIVDVWREQGIFSASHYATLEDNTTERISPKLWMDYMLSIWDADPLTTKLYKAKETE